MADIGQGATFAFSTSVFTIQARSIAHTGVSRASIDITHLGSTTSKAFMKADLYDPGQVTVRWLYDPDVQPPITGNAETITITFPLPSGKTTAATMSCSGFVTSFDEPDLTEEGPMEASMTVKLTGAITWTDSTP